MEKTEDKMRNILFKIFFIYIGVLPMIGIVSSVFIITDAPNRFYKEWVIAAPAIIILHLLFVNFIPLFTGLFFRSIKFPQNKWMALLILIDGPIQLILLPLFGVKLNIMEFMLVEFGLEYAGFSLGTLIGFFRLVREEPKTETKKEKDIFDFVFLFFIVLIFLLPSFGFVYLNIAVLKTVSIFALLSLFFSLITTVWGYSKIDTKIEPGKAEYSKYKWLWGYLETMRTIQFLVIAVLTIGVLINFETLWGIKILNQ